jgi:ankyrin repeat protein
MSNIRIKITERTPPKLKPKTSTVHPQDLPPHVETEERLDINTAQLGDKKTALFMAIENGHVEAAKRILQHGAANEGDSEGVTPLHLAAAAGYMELLKIFVEKKEDLNKEDNKGRTPLYFAAEKGQRAAAEYLLQAGANLNRVEGPESSCPLHIARQNQHDGTVTLLNQYKNARGCLIQGIKENEVGIPKALFDRKRELMIPVINNIAEPDKVFTTAQPPLTPLFIAIRYNRDGIVALLLENGASLKLNYDGIINTALHFVCQDNIHKYNKITEEEIEKKEGTETKEEIKTKERILKEILKYKQNINMRNEGNKTALHIALEKKRFSLAKILIEAGADVNAKNNAGRSVLYNAVEAGNFEIVGLLVKRGASIHEEDKFGHTILDIAKELANSKTNEETSSYQTKSISKNKYRPKNKQNK